MKIAFLTTWSVRCGIFSYTKFLIDSLNKLGHETFVLCQNVFGDEVDFEKGFDGKNLVLRCWDWYGRTNKTDINIDAIVDVVEECDVLHIQYESFLYHQDFFKELLKKIKIPYIITYHSSCIGPSCPTSGAFANIVHDENFPELPNRYVVPMGIPDFGLVDSMSQYKHFGSFGLARNNDELAGKALEHLSVNEKMEDVAYKTHYGSSKWIPINELVSILKQWRAIVLLYPETNAVVSSSAACVAIGTGVPVICTNTGWFNHVKDYVHLVDSNIELFYLLKKYLDGDEKWWKDSQVRAQRALNERSWKAIAKRHIYLYEKSVC